MSTPHVSHAESTVAERPGVDRSPMLAAVGIPLGELHVNDPDALGGSVVMSRTDLIELTADAYKVWIGGLAPRTRSELCVWGESRQVQQSEELVDELLSIGLLVQLPGPTDPTAGWPNDYRLLPQGVGIGNTADDRGRYSIGDRLGAPVLEVDARIYHVWALSANTASLAEAVDLVSSMMAVATRDLMPIVYGALPYLLAQRSAYLDGRC